jgi:NAD(P)-dependent dehydrogenase (short-subunit alcohol dehydrogenase family)
MKLKDKVAIITGGARGIGRAVALRYAREGAMSVIADLLAEEAQRTSADIVAAGGKSFAVPLDVTKQDSIDALVKTAADRAGGIDILFNNAGVFEIQPILEVTHESWDRVFAVNTRGLFFVLQTVARQMVAQGRGGKVVNLASEAGRQGVAMVVQYCASKAAVISITQSAGLALIKDRINVNAIAPGVIDTPMVDMVDKLFTHYEGRPTGERKKNAHLGIPMGRIGVPDDLVGAAVFLASADSDYVVGQTLNVDGGRMLN